MSIDALATDGPRDHVLRAPLPWRTDHLTECGRRSDDVATCITLDDLTARIKKHGKQRTAFTVCITCWNTSANAAQWETNPVGVIWREAQRAGIGSTNPSIRPEAVRLTHELRAIAALIAAHPEEFSDYLTGLRETTSLADHRRHRNSHR